MQERTKSFKFFRLLGGFPGLELGGELGHKRIKIRYPTGKNSLFLMCQDIFDPQMKKLQV